MTNPLFRPIPRLTPISRWDASSLSFPGNRKTFPIILRLLLLCIENGKSFLLEMNGEENDPDRAKHQAAHRRVTAVEQQLRATGLEDQYEEDGRFMSTRRFGKKRSWQARQLPMRSTSLLAVTKRNHLQGSYLGVSLG